MRIVCVPISGGSRGPRARRVVLSARQNRVSRKKAFCVLSDCCYAAPEIRDHAEVSLALAGAFGARLFAGQKPGAQAKAAWRCCCPRPGLTPTLPLFFVHSNGPFLSPSLDDRALWHLGTTKGRLKGQRREIDYVCICMYSPAVSWTFVYFLPLSLALSCSFGEAPFFRLVHGLDAAARSEDDATLFTFEASHSNRSLSTISANFGRLLPQRKGKISCVYFSRYHPPPCVFFLNSFYPPS